MANDAISYVTLFAQKSAEISVNNSVNEISNIDDNIH